MPVFSPIALSLTPPAWSARSPLLSSSSSPRPPAETRHLAEGDQGTEDTVREMVRLIEEGSRDPDINALAIAIVRRAGVRQFDFEGERRALYRWMRQSIRFFKDIDGKETLKSAKRTVELGGGDCDCQTILICALLKTIGHRTRIVTISSHAQAPKIFSHVFAEARNERGDWIPVDAARKNAGYARGPNHWYRRRHWDTEDGSFEDVRGLNFYVANSFPLPTTGRGPFLLQPGVPCNSPAASGGLPPAVRKRMAKRAAMSGLAQDDSSFDWSQLETELPSIEQGTAQIISASRASPYNITATSAPGASLTSAYSSSLSEIPVWVWLIGGGVLIFAMTRNR